jgi:hypothetical protein
LLAEADFEYVLAKLGNSRRVAGLNRSIQMKTALAFIIVLTATFPAFAEEVSLSGAGQSLTLTLPDGFVAVTSPAPGADVIFEAVPTGETAETWTQKLQVTAHEAWLDDPSTYVSVVSSSYFDLCKDTFGESAFGSKEVAGSEDSYGYWVACGTLDQGAGPISEMVLLLAITTKDHHFSVRWYERGTAMDEAPDDEDYWEERLDQMETAIRF